MIRYLKKAKNILAMSASLALIAFVSCKEKSRYPGNIKLEGQSILDIEYINDTLDINLVDFRITDLQKRKKMLEIFVITDELAKYSQGYSYFVHMYPTISSESDEDFIALGTKSVDSLGGILVYKREFELDATYFELIRYGLLNEKGERLFTLTLDSVNIE